jgi:hypothetical protein
MFPKNTRTKLPRRHLGICVTTDAPILLEKAMAIDILSMDQTIKTSMEQAIKIGDAIDLRYCKSWKESHHFHYIIDNFDEEKDYCDTDRMVWINSIGKRRSDGVIIGSTGFDLFTTTGVECLWLR